MSGIRETMALAAQSRQFVIFGDTHHSYVPLYPLGENMDVLKDSGSQFFFVEQHYSLQPVIEQLARGEINADQFIDLNRPYNDDEFWGHHDIADTIIAATQQGMRVVAYDTRFTEGPGMDPANALPPNMIPNYPADLLPHMMEAHSKVGTTSFDKRTAEFVETVADGRQAGILIGNGHINGSHYHGDAEGDFDGHLGDAAARVTMFYDAEHYAEYSSKQNMATENTKCATDDQPDYLYVAAEDVGIATASALNRGLQTGDLSVGDIPSVCYMPENPRIISSPGLQGPALP